MTDDLRARITQALEGCRVLTPDAQADAVMAVIAPEFERVRTHARDYSRGHCRACGATDPAVSWPEQQRRPHRMWCRLYVGPLKHRRERTRITVLGNTRNVCACGKEWDENAAGCPDAAVDWRGPKSDAERVTSSVEGEDPDDSTET